MPLRKFLDTTLLQKYSPARTETYHQARDLAQVLMAVFVMLAFALLLSRDPMPVQAVVLGMLLFCIALLLMIRFGHLSVATMLGILGLAAMASLIVVQRQTFDQYELFYLTSINLFTLLMATLLTYRPLYSYAAMSLGIVIVVAHYFLRAIPHSAPGMEAELDDLLISLGLLAIAGLIAGMIVERRDSLARALEAESTDSRRRAVELEQSRAVLNAVIDQSPIPMIIADSDGTIVTLNNALVEYAGEEATGGLKPGVRLSDTGVGWRIFDIDGKEIRIDQMPLIRSLDGVVTPGKEMRYQLQDGTSRWAIQYATPIYDANGELVAGFSAFSDITQRKAAEDALRESEEKFRNLIEHSSEAIYLLYERRFEVVNRKFEEMFGVTLDDVNAPDFDFMDLVAPESRQIVEDRMTRHDLGERLEPAYEFTALTAHGDLVSVEATVSYVKYKDGIATQGILRDVTEKRRLEEQLSHSQKMDAVGRLAGGIAHDFNNLLTVIIGYSEISLLQELPADTVQNLEQILDAGRRAKSLTSQLLAFSRKQIIQPKIIEVNKLIRELNQILARLLGEDIEIVIQLNADSDTILVDPGQMEQVVLNVAVNARDAMPFGGKLTIKTCNSSPEPAPKSGYVGEQPVNLLVLRISDTGVGMSDSIRSRIFEPFFTTKGRDKGTGLGLATVYGIVMQNNGTIQVNSEQGSGSSFEISFPVERTQVVSENAASEESESLSGNETILLVEDDPSVRDYMSSTIARRGYKVLTAENGEAALEVHAANANYIDLVVSDVVMPVMSGPELVEQLHNRQADLKCLFVSGYTDDAIVHHGVLDEGIELMQKPFSGRDLLTRIRQLLDAPYP